jgi:nifR3 family TIM-barrel protein
MILPSHWPAHPGPALFLAPMAGFCDQSFRRLCKGFGAEVLTSEFVMANAVLNAGDDSRLWDLVRFGEDERPFGIQLFGADAGLLGEAAAKVRERFRPDFIDLNYGCPAPKIVGQNAGSALLKDLPNALAIAKAVVEAAPDTPVTAKMRLGWDFSHIVAADFAKMLESVGVRAVTVHGRTRIQGYSGDADWKAIAAVVKAVQIPVVGNGAVNGTYPAEIIRESGVAGVMVGRAALGNPWIFRQLRAALAGEAEPEKPTPDQRRSALLAYARSLDAAGETFSHIRPKIKPFTGDLAGARKLRHAIDGAKTLAELEALLTRPV